MVSLKGKRLLICEEALIGYKGHFYSWIKAIRSIHRQAGAEVLVAGSKDIDPSIKEEFGVVPAYSRNSWSGIYDYKQSWRRYLAVFAHNYRLYRETKRLLKSTGPVDCILLPAARIYHLMAWRWLCKKRLGKDFQRVVIFVLTSEAVYNESFTDYSFKRSSGLIKYVLAGFGKEVKAGRVVLAGDSHITCGEYTRLAGVPFRVFPSPAAGLEASGGMQPLPASVSKSPSTVPSFVILGVSVIDKGIDLLQEAIVKLLKHHPDLPARFIIQWGTPTINYDGMPVPISDTLRQAPQVTLLEQVLGEEEYKQYLQTADFIVLPYRRKVYFNRLSGVAIEAACAGVPMIVTENTWLSWAVEAFGAGVTVKDDDADDLAEKIMYCLSQWQFLKEKAQERKAVALAMNSTQQYLKCVWE
jgi:glycosyltransferase involved in cell wall biosynthesis